MYFRIIKVLVLVLAMEGKVLVLVLASIKSVKISKSTEFVKALSPQSQLLRRPCETAGNRCEVVRASVSIVFTSAVLRSARFTDRNIDSGHSDAY